MCPFLLRRAGPLSLGHHGRWPPLESWMWSENPGPSMFTPPLLALGCIYYLPLLHLTHSSLHQEVWTLKKELEHICFSLSLPVSSASPPWSRRIFYLQLFGSSPCVIIFFLFLVTQNSNTLFQASQGYSSYTDGSFGELGENSSLSAWIWRLSLTFHITNLAWSPKLSQDSLFWVVSPLPLIW